MLSQRDQELIAVAREAIKRCYRNDWQAVCAEAVALGRAVTDVGETGIETIVAVRHPDPGEADQAIVVVSPCGSCRELIWDYDRNARVIVPSANGPVVAGIGELLPNKYSRERTL